jgi:hypothetical protein
MGSRVIGQKQIRHPENYRLYVDKAGFAGIIYDSKTRVISFVFARVFCAGEGAIDSIFFRLIPTE